MGMSQGTEELIGLLGSGILGGITAPTSQKLKSFEGTATDPRDMASQAKSLIEGYLGQTQERAQAGTHLDTTVNPLPSFVGGGLPMTVAAPGMDERRIARRTLPAPAGNPTISRDPSDPGNGGKIPIPNPTDSGPTGGPSDQALAAITLLKKSGLQF